mmetsp:Transcript_24170/g.95173  ORF Transcript_24170/g.95173 Transcript_24170/m.95173 type:complete len:221 (+) Transcript_24170:153-815(+)
MWFAKDGSKAWAEKFFLFVNLSSLILFLVVFIGSGLYERYDDRVSYAVVSGLMVLPNIVVPVVLVGKSDKVLPWYTRFVWKANMWNLVFGFIGNYFWTHYFYKILGARYTFDTFRLNDVPIPCYLATHVYFLFYHSVSSITLRKLDEATTKLPTPLRRAIFVCGVLMLAYLTAYMETLTISAFPYVLKLTDVVFYYLWAGWFLALCNLLYCKLSHVPSHR